jgi:putative nucleotidyltransferase with HDIG domain
MLQTELGKIDAVLSALDQKRPEVAAHCRRVSALSVRLAAQYGLDPSVIETIRLGGLLHDVGKLLTPVRILNKPGRPNAREWQELKNHPELGMEIAHRSGFDDDVCGIVLYHHERYDGQGYPDGLAHPAIHHTIRIVSVMDTFDALTSPRDYRERLSVEAARVLIARGAGTKFCPWIVSGFLALPMEMLRLATDEARVGSRHPEGQVLLPMDQLTHPRRPRADLYQSCQC